MDSLENFRKKYLTRFNALKRKSYIDETQKVLGDPLLWLRLAQPDKEVSSLFDREDISNLKLDVAGDCFKKRLYYCDKSLQKAAGDKESQALYLKKLSETRHITTGRDLRNALFPDSLPLEVLPAVNLNVSPQNDALVSPESVSSPQGLVTDLYVCPGDNGWEGYIMSFDSAVYRFTTESCNCVFPICLGSYVEFCPHANTVAEHSLRMVRYIPGALPANYAEDYLQQLEGLLKSSDSLIQRILQLPGPFAALVNDARFYKKHVSSILAILYSSSKDESDFFSTILYIFFTSQFIQELPQMLEEKHVPYHYCRDVQYFLCLAATCVRYFPKSAYLLTPVIQGCARLASSFETELADECSNICQAVVHACSVVRKEDVSASSESTIQETAEESTPQQLLLDPLLWVSCCFGKRVAHSLRKLLLHTPLSENEEVVVARRRFENTIPTKHSLGHLPEQLQIVKKVSSPGCLDSKVAIKTGIVIDLYKNGVGYIAIAPSQGYPRKEAQIFRIDESTSVRVTSAVSELWVHIGDVVKFQVRQDCSGVVQIIVRVTQYCSQALDEEFARQTLLSPNNECRNVEELLQNEAALRGIFNAPLVYSNTELCTALIVAVTDALSDNSTPSIKKKMLDLLKSSSFILDLIERAPQEVSKSLNIFQKYLVQFPNEISNLENTLYSMVTCLWQEHKLQELATFLSFLSTSSCILPPSIEIQQQPWQSIPTILTVDELKAGAIADKVYLPVVKDCGSYNSIEEYGRTYYVLLRADCHGNLVSVISKLREPASSTKKEPVEGSGTLVCYARFIGLSNRSSGHHLVYHFNMESKPFPSENVSRNSPLFKSGNLLCFSIAGRFENDIIWATINHVSSYVHTINTEKERLVKSCDVCVEFCTESNVFPDEEAMQLLKGSRNAVALESPAYYRAYQPVLEVLKQMDLQKIHFMPDLLKPTEEPKASLHLIHDDVMVTDIAGLYSDKATDVPKEITVGDLKEKLAEGSEGFCLSEHQRKAVNQALSQALSLIHGPPGTGKSYMGMQLLRLFLSMTDCHSKKAVLENKPALVMAYRNRALDHFILLCKSFCPLDDTSIVRIGHVSKDNEDTLKPLRLKERVMAALPRGDVVRFHSTLQYRFERVKEACGVLEAITKLESLDDYLDTLTPEWLKSLILHSPLFHGHDVTRIVENNDSCLTLLKKQQLGREDREKQQVIKTALEVAWNEWIKGASSCQNPINRESKKCKTFADEDSEAEYEWQVEEEHWDDDTEFETLTPYYYDSEKDAPVEVDNVWKLDPDGRRRLIIQSCSDRYVMAMEELKDSVKQYNVTRELYERMYQRKALEILKQAKIVAMTTTGAAIHQQLVSQLEAPVVFVEEAAEILESNLLAVLTPHVKNMVLIGDHKQLKPNLSWNRLERNKFNVSLFERLIKNDYPRTLLLRQNRMHRDLVPLYGYHYYSEKKYKGSKEILSSDKTEALEKPKCMAKNFFWWSYKDKYEKRHECSQYNEHEVEMVVRLCSWLVCNKVASSSVAVLTPYRGQLEKIEESLKDFAMKYKCMPSDLSLIPVYTVDEFQGHERDVVILSLVRSNSKGEIGFLSRFNRLVVGTSRQKCALYIVGNHTFLEKSSLLLWKGFIEKCKERDSESIGTGLPIIVSDNQQCVCQSPEDLDERVEKLLQIIANNATVEPDNGPSSLTSESTVSTPASVRSQPHRTSEHTLDDVQPHSVPALPPPVYTHTPRKDPLRQQSSPAILIPTPNQSAQVDSSTSAPSWNFHECLLELKDTDAITKWKFIGRRLALEEPTINSIEKRYERDIKEAFYQMMLEWKKCQGKEATCDKIIECLEKEQLKDVADKIRKYQVY